jgi:NTE family protein
LAARGANVLLLLDGSDRDVSPSPVVHLSPADADAVSALPSDALVLGGWSARRSGSSRRVWVDVPTAADHISVQRGLLPLDTPLGRRIGGIARELCGQRVGLALGEGSIKGFAHLGVLKRLHSIGVPIDTIAGTSIGAVVAALHATGATPDDARARLTEVGAATYHPRISRSAVMSHADVAQMMRSLWGATTRIEDLGLPCGLVAADLATGHEVVMTRGPLWAAVLASISIPGVYPPQRMGARLLVDGGIIDPVPTRVARSLGADVVVGVRLSTRGAAVQEDIEAVAPTGRVPSVVRTLLRTWDVMQTRSRPLLPDASLIIEPKFPAKVPMGLRDFSSGAKYTEAGETAALDAHAALSGLLPWLRE